MVGVDDINFDEVMKVVVKWDEIFTPNPRACPGLTFKSFKEMEECVGDRLEAARKRADKLNMAFVPYTVSHKLKPEFEGEVQNPSIQEMSD